MNFHKFEKGVTEKVIEENKERFRDDIDRMIASAIYQAEHEANSHRKFHVGAVAATYDMGTHEYQVGGSGNYKPWEVRPEGEEKACAERLATEDARNDDTVYVVGIVIASKETHADPNAHAEHPTLHPCPECQQMFADNPGTFRDDTLLVTVHYTVEEVLNDDGTSDMKAKVVSREMFTLPEFHDLHITQKGDASLN
ncbi:MAG: hypothetical protein COU32_03820 [Candidatus Magasanikbacteria bacterium CG10_big_fil_rev_8_21_14_0_10_42_10]|nr:MAG: hypothetical protein COU32_03820 [Candidatus Magasanikbacteria bacterium CG10_big_fil_rev_8_21_14_0_10_42_10]